MAPSKVPAPELYARYTWVKELALKWEDTGEPLDSEDIGTLAKMLNIKHECDDLKSRAGQSGGRF